MFASNTSQASDATYIEDVFSTWLYTGNSSTQTITNGIDLAGKGGLVWVKSRSAATNNFLFDTNRGALNEINSNTTDAQASLASSLTTFNANGFALGSSANINANAATYASWTFRKQPKFFDVVTWTGSGANRTIAHNLGSVPGCIIVKRTDTSSNWQVYHRSLTSAANSIQLNLTNAQAAAATIWNSTTPTSTVFSLGTDATVNASGGTYVAYIYAHDAGGFGLSGNENVISCGSFTTDGSKKITPVNLGWEPQWMMIKRTDSASNWIVVDNMRGWGAGTTNSGFLFPNASGAEDAGGDSMNFTSTGLGASSYPSASSTFIYIAIRRGPMRTPTSGTSVFGLNARTGTGANATVTGSAGVSDAVLIKNRGSAVGDLFASRLTGTGYLETSSTAAEVAAGTTILQANPWDVMDGVKVGTTSTITNASSNTYINYLFDRAPGFMDVVCYNGTGSNQTISHNLGVTPELVIVKSRVGDGVTWPATGWLTYAAPLGIVGSGYLKLNSTEAGGGGSVGVFWNSFSATTFSVGTASEVNQGSGNKYIAYLFASCPGVSKIGSYTGNGTNQTINCGFTGGARFILIKRTDSTGDWYVWDTARGIVTGNDPRMSLNSSAAEVTTDDTIDPDNSGFIVNQLAATNVNVNNATYIYLAIA